MNYALFKSNYLLSPSPRYNIFLFSMLIELPLPSKIEIRNDDKSEVILASQLFSLQSINIYKS